MFEVKTDSVTLGCITAAAIIGLSKIGIAHDSLPIAAAASVGITLIAYVTVTQVFTANNQYTIHE